MKRDLQDKLEESFEPEPNLADLIAEFCHPSSDFLLCPSCQARLIFQEQKLIIDVDYERAQRRLNEIRAQHKEKRSCLDKDTLKERLKDVEAQLKLCPESSDSDLKTSRDQLILRLETDKRVKDFRPVFEKRRDLRKKIEDTETEINALQALKAKMILVRYKCLSNLTEIISSLTNQILSEIIKDPIILCLQVFRELKTRVEPKPQINLRISYRGREIDQPRSLSKGELDRVSLSLTLALSELRRSEMIFLDETTSSLDSEARDAVFSCLRRFENVSVIAHGEEDRIFDKVLSL